MLRQQRHLQGYLDTNHQNAASSCKPFPDSPLTHQLAIVIKILLYKNNKKNPKNNLKRQRLTPRAQPLARRTPDDFAPCSVQSSMASVFTYDPDPPRISSPWRADLHTPGPTSGSSVPVQALGGLQAPPSTRIEDLGIEKLEPEPQSGPTEYKVHLLLRPRRALASCSTGPWVSGSHASGRPSPAPGQQRRMGNSSEKDATQGPSSAAAKEVAPSASPLPVPTHQARQLRLQHLTTQLLWRLQQSSPFHASAAATSVGISLPDVSTIGAQGPTPTLRVHGRATSLHFPGLAESHGALYEIGVADDGSLVGLARDEMDESIAILRVMASSLGCLVEICRIVEVGHCTWSEAPPSLPPSGNSRAKTQPGSILHCEPLWVVEAYVSLDMSMADDASLPRSAFSAAADTSATQTRNGFARAASESIQSHTEQLRMALTGATATGKSSLLGTLSTSTLDNGRGKSRLSLLKHHHEIRTGLTSSIAPELLGYQSRSTEAGHSDDMSRRSHDLVINYGFDNISSWNDIHHEAAGGRLVLWTDAGGHQKYKRTLIRSLVSWSPHWVACCIAADGGNGASDGSVDLSKAHLDICLQLDLPLLVVITRMDMAVAFLRKNLNDILPLLRAAGRTPVILQLGRKVIYEAELQTIPAEDAEEKQSKLDHVPNGEKHKYDPIVLTSALTGACIGKLHALLRELPLPKVNATEKDLCRFHVDEIFVKLGDHLGHDDSAESPISNGQATVILSGLLRCGSLSVGDDLLLGPFLPESLPIVHCEQTTMQRARSYPARLDSTSRASSPPRPDVYEPRRRSGDFLWPTDRTTGTSRLSGFADEWMEIKVLSIRNLRLPQRTLLPDQAGTIGVSFPGNATALATRLRKGMVVIRDRSSTLDSHKDGPTSGFSARFAERDYRVMEPGALFVVCVAIVSALS